MTLSKMALWHSEIATMRIWYRYLDCHIFTAVLSVIMQNVVKLVVMVPSTILF
jgi:hypothetical protein